MFIKKFILLSFLFGVVGTSAAQDAPETWLTIFVHGIMSIKPHISYNNFLRFMTDDVNDTVYSKTVELMRNDPIFYQNQAMQEIGLVKIDLNRIEPGYASGALATSFDAMIQFAYPNHSIKNHYYTFGWSGLLSPTQRFDDAQKLYTALAQEVDSYRKQKIEPKVRIIGYSHGGNVCLYIAKVAQKAKENALSVDELILLGMPVQSETDHLVNDPMFKKIFHIYSRGDRIQKLDFFSFNRFFSRRIFKSRNDFELPDKLIQVQIRCTRNTIYGNYNQEKFIGAYNFSSKPLIGGKSRFLRESSPGHTELWFFGWTPANYRKTFPLNPLPAVALVPIITQAALNFEERILFEKPTLIDIRPEHEIILIKNQKSRNVLSITPFLTRQEFDALKKKVMAFAPANYTAEIYSGQIKTAYDAALDEHQKERVGKKRAKKSRTKQAIP